MSQSSAKKQSIFQNWLYTAVNLSNTGGCADDVCEGLQILVSADAGVPRAFLLTDGDRLLQLFQEVLGSFVDGLGYQPEELLSSVPAPSSPVTEYPTNFMLMFKASSRF